MRPVTIPNDRMLDLPTRWGEVTLGQFDCLTKLPEAADVYSFLSVFLNLAPVEVMNLPATFVNEQVLPVLDFAASTVPDFESFTLPPNILLPFEFDERQLPVVKSFAITSFG